MAFSYKVLGQANPAADTLTTAYTVPAATEAVVSSIMVANRGAADTRFRIAVRPDGATISDEHYVAYDVLIAANSLFALSVGITLDENDIVSVYADDATVSFNVFGSEVA